MAGDHLRARPSRADPCAIGHVSGGDHRRLRVHGEIQLRCGPFVEELHEIYSERRDRLGAYFGYAGKTVVALEHADSLRALPRKHHGEFHSVARLAPQVKPPPTPCIITRWPARIFPARTNSSSASGTDAAEVLAWCTTGTTSLSRGRPSLRAVASRMRTFAWCGMSQSTSSRCISAAASVSRATSSSPRTANLNTPCPFICRNGESTMQPRDRWPGAESRPAWFPSACSTLAWMPGLSPATSATAPAPSPNSTQVPRSFQSRMRENTSAPITSAFRY